MLKKAILALQADATYRAGLLQAKAYRTLKQRTNAALASYGIASIHWAFLGLLHDEAPGMRLSAIAAELGVEASFVSVLFDQLKEKGLALKEKDPVDKRASIIRLTPAGRSFVSKTEKALRKRMKPLFDRIPADDLLAYLSVLQKIVENDAE